jgi:hypothetical protein
MIIERAWFGFWFDFDAAKKEYMAHSTTEK